VCAQRVMRWSRAARAQRQVLRAPRRRWQCRRTLLQRAALCGDEGPDGDHLHHQSKAAVCPVTLSRPDRAHRVALAVVPHQCVSTMLPIIATLPSIWRRQSR
jgi:hypothetical protein